MPKTAVALFETSSTADKVVAHLLKSDFARDEVGVMSRSDFEGNPHRRPTFSSWAACPIHAGRYWDAVRNGRVLVTVTASGDRADRQPIS